MEIRNLYELVSDALGNSLFWAGASQRQAERGKEKRRIFFKETSQTIDVEFLTQLKWTDYCAALIGNIGASSLEFKQFSKTCSFIFCR